MPRQRKRGARRPWRRRLVLAAVGLLGAAGAWLLWPFWQLSDQLGGRHLRVPSRLYGSPMRLAAGDTLRRASVVEELEALGYRPSAGRPGPAQYRAGEGEILVQLRPAPAAGGIAPGGLLEIKLAGSRIRELRSRGERVRQAALDPPLLTSYYGEDLAERWPARLDELPEELVHAVLAAEDAGFFEHPGLSATGILRAAWVNLRGGEVLQGGSTITQQVVKNLYLSHERTLLRKVREAALALVLEARYSKKEILEAYLNGIYWGRSGSANLIGVGAAARGYFGKDARELDLNEAAVLAGLIRAPGNYLPSAHPERARERRDWVLERMAELGWIDEDRRKTVQAQPLPKPGQPFRRRAPYFAALAEAEAAERFGIEDLAGGGYTLVSTLRREDQEEAEAAVAWGLKALEKGWEKGQRRAGPLQAALVSLDPGSGAILAYVGGRDYAASQFDRASQARRQAGSAFKAVVYAAAFEAGVASPATLLEDAPLTVRLAGQTWEPHNDDESFRGWVSARTALEQSVNLPTARLALQLGLPRIVGLARGMGVTTPLKPFPALALGAFEVTPLELAQVFATFAAGGRRPPVHGLAAVLDPSGRPIEGTAPPPAERVLSPQTAYLITSILQGVLDRGTGASVREQGVSDRLAGKTGTTNGRRDSWFAGYSPERTTLVWVGYDDNAETRLSGSRAALPIWGRFIQAVRPPGGYPDFAQPEGIVTALIDPSSGELATADCPQVMTEVFRQGGEPQGLCRLHSTWFERAFDRTSGVVEEGAHPVRRWLKRVFGHDRDRDRDLDAEPAPPPPP